MHKKSFYKACYASAPSYVLKLLVRLLDKRVVEMRAVDKVLDVGSCGGAGGRCGGGGGR